MRESRTYGFMRPYRNLSPSPFSLLSLFDRCRSRCLGADSLKTETSTLQLVAFLAGIARELRFPLLVRDRHRIVSVP
jgi:hypothetical protein